MALAKHNRGTVARKKNTKAAFHLCGALVANLQNQHHKLGLSGASELSRQNYFLRFNKKFLESDTKYRATIVPQMFYLLLEMALGLCLVLLHGLCHTIAIIVSRDCHFCFYQKSGAAFSALKSSLHQCPSSKALSV